MDIRELRKALQNVGIPIGEDETPTNFEVKGLHPYQMQSQRDVTLVDIVLDAGDIRVKIQFPEVIGFDKQRSEYVSFGLPESTSARDVAQMVIGALFVRFMTFANAQGFRQEVYQADDEPVVYIQIGLKLFLLQGITFVGELDQ